MSLLDVSVLLGGLAVFLHGLALTREGLQIMAGEKLRTVLFALTRNRLLGLVSGAMVTTVVQSSTATTAMLVGFAGSALLTLPQAMAVVLGADVGTTLTVQLLSFRVATWSLALVAAGFGIRFTSRKRRNRYMGQALLGLGLLFYGMKLMGDATLPLRASPAFAEALQYLAGRPFAGLAAAAVVTVMMQGSAPTIGLLIAMAGAGSMHVTAALPMVLGANVGTTLTPIVAAAGAPAEGKRVAFAHGVFKVVGVALWLPFLGPLQRLVALLGGPEARQIANAHTLFNVVNALLFLPFVGAGAALITRYYRPEEERAPFRPRYLDPRALESPALAFGNAQREFLRMADLVGDMVKDCLRPFEQNDLDLAAEIEARDDQVDILDREIRFYLAKLGAEEAMTPEQTQRQLELISLSSDLENVGDVVNRNILALARRKAAHGLAFSQPGWAEIRGFHEKVCENYDLATVAFSAGDEELARKVLRHRLAIVEIEAQLKEQHIGRLAQGLRESIETSSMHLDLLSFLRRINGLVGNLAQAVVERRQQPAEGTP
ncbi:Na/Pi cotransporter family protein [Anaeromyxobacter paludicola]|uniref:Na/Pi cotransporter II-like protein n=1 Tax=Anaeromyxobacter paludicola TaxID=2918171 RepID=A0ABM7XAV9_9BACT|nr:Na/Pi cotransporter family protein [Anaeromyxobacter paludicola]BDG08997.1 Na/Pi cotransporter II-like protein [Anaeromyxobacter paludicola]